MIPYDPNELRDLAQKRASTDRFAVLVLAMVEDMANLRTELEQARADAARGHESQAALRIVAADRDALQREVAWLRAQLEGRDDPPQAADILAKMREKYGRYFDGVDPQELRGDDD